MANLEKNMSVVSKEIAYMFSSKSYAGRTMNTQYDKSYEYTGAAAGSSIQIKQPHRFYVTDGATATIQDDEERTVVLPRATQKHIMLAFGAAEMAHDLTKADAAEKFFGSTRTATAVQTLAGNTDADTYANLIPTVYQAVRGGETTNPSSTNDIGLIKARLDDSHAPEGDRCAILTTKHMLSLNTGTVALFNPASKKSDDYSSGELGDIAGIKFYNSTFLPTHQQGTAAAGTIKTTVAVEGTTSMVIDGLSTDSITAGSIFTVANVYSKDVISKENGVDLQQFVVVSATATAGGESTVVFEPAIEIEATNAYANCSAYPVATAVVTFEGIAGANQSQSFAYHKDACVFATVDLPMIGCTIESQIRDEEMGLAMKLTGQGDITTLKKRTRLDILYGSVVVNPLWAVRIWGA
jgi:hypothetical protein